MQIDDFIELVHKRRSIRRFKPGVIPREDIEKILEAGRWAMSGANGQPWEFVVLDDPAIMQKIYDSWLEPRVELMR
jgi:nitroreductase